MLCMSSSSLLVVFRGRDLVLSLKLCVRVLCSRTLAVHPVKSHSRLTDCLLGGWSSVAAVW